LGHKKTRGIAEETRQGKSSFKACMKLSDCPLVPTEANVNTRAVLLNQGKGSHVCMYHASLSWTMHSGKKRKAPERVHASGLGDRLFFLI
jgi:hypothetical protein